MGLTFILSNMPFILEKNLAPFGYSYLWFYNKLDLDQMILPIIDLLDWLMSIIVVFMNRKLNRFQLILEF